MTPSPISTETLLSEVDELIRSAPSLSEFRSVEHLEWIGRATAVVEGWGGGLQWGILILRLNEPTLQYTGHVARQMLTMLHQVRHDLMLRSGPIHGKIVDRGDVFAYFDEIRKILEGSQEEILFVDPYLDVEFASRYLVNIRSGVSVRLLTKPKNFVRALQEAAKLIEQQQGIKVEIRTVEDIHDRHLIVDRKMGYVSGASFKDGAKRAPAILSQIVDAFDAVLETYEKKWSEASKLI